MTIPSTFRVTFETRNGSHEYSATVFATSRSAARRIARAEVAARVGCSTRSLVWATLAPVQVPA